MTPTLTIIGIALWGQLLCGVVGFAFGTRMHRRLDQDRTTGIQPGGLGFESPATLQGPTRTVETYVPKHEGDIPGWGT